MATGQLFYDPIARPLSSVGLAMPGAYYNFYISGSSTPATVFQDPALTLPYPTQPLNGNPGFSLVQADGSGAMPPIYLNPQLIYRVQLYTSGFQLVEDVDPYVPAMPTTGNGPIQIDAQGEVTINAPTPGGTGITLSVAARSGGQAVQLTAAAVGSAAIIANSTVVVGTTTATFAATNKPGSGTTSPSKWLPIQCDGALYYIPLWQ